LHGFGRERDSLSRERQWSSPDRDSHPWIVVLGNEKGGVVRRPFSTLQAWLIAVSPQPGVALAIGTAAHGLEASFATEAGRRSGV